MSRWYRAYEGTVTDAKLGEVALVADCSRSVAIAAWHCLLESAASVNDGGKFDHTARRIAVILGEKPATIEAVLAELTALGMIADGVICAWSRRQYESDNSTERSRKHRERKRNGDATLQDSCATPPYTETETDTEETPLSPLGAEQKDYAFAGRVIRLKQRDLGQWSRTYHGIPDITAELSSLDAWFCKHPAKQKDWFHTTAGALNRKHQEALMAKKATGPIHAVVGI